MNITRQRESLQMTQAEYWTRVGITQSGGSRYEKKKRGLQKPIALLLAIAYGSPSERARTLKALCPK